MKIASYQAPLLMGDPKTAIGLIRAQIDICESEDVDILCCPEAILGGLADYAADPDEIAVDVANGDLAALLKPLASKSVTTIIGFTEAANGRLYNSSAVFDRGVIAGVYRKLHPAIRRSVYTAGDKLPVFTLDGFTFGILICNDSNFPELAANLASLGAVAIFIPTNSALPHDRKEVTADARRIDIAIATDNNIWVIRSDVAGRTDSLVAYGSSCIAGPGGNVLKSAKRSCESLIIADIRS